MPDAIKRTREANERNTNIDPDSAKSKGCCPYVIPDTPLYDDTATAGQDDTLPSNAVFRVSNGDGTSTLHVKD